MAASEEQVKFLIDVSAFSHPMIEEYDEGPLKDKVRDELYEEIKSEIIEDIQNACDSKEGELDSQIADIEQAVESAKDTLNEIISSLSDLTANTAFRVEDEV